MARGDKRKRNIKRDWTFIKGGNPAAVVSQEKTFKSKKDGLPDLKGLGVKLERRAKVDTTAKVPCIC